MSNVGAGNLQAGTVNPTFGTAGRAKETESVFDLSGLANTLGNLGKVVGANADATREAEQDALLGRAQTQLSDIQIARAAGFETSAGDILGVNDVDTEGMTEKELNALKRTQTLAKRIDLLRKQGKKETATDLELMVKATELARANPTVADKIFAMTGVTSEDLQEDIAAEEEFARERYQNSVTIAEAALNELGLVTGSTSDSEVLRMYEKHIAPGQNRLASIEKQLDLLNAKNDLSEAERKSEYLSIMQKEVPQFVTSTGSALAALARSDADQADKVEQWTKIQISIQEKITNSGLNSDEVQKAFGPILDMLEQSRQVIVGEAPADAFSNRLKIQQKMIELEFAEKYPRLYRIGKLAKDNPAFGDIIANQSTTVRLLAEATKGFLENEDLGGEDRPISDFFKGAEGTDEIRKAGEEAVNYFRAWTEKDNATADELAFFGRNISDFLENDVHDKSMAGMDALLPFLADNKSLRLSNNPEIAGEIEEKARLVIPTYLRKLDDSLTERIKRQAGVGNLKVVETEDSIRVEFARTDLRQEQLDVPLRQLKASVGELNKRLDWAVKAYANHAAGDANRGNLVHAKETLFGDIQ